MEAYRDQYATLFNAGHGVTVIGISADPDTALASWAHDLGTPTGRAYGLPSFCTLVPEAASTAESRPV